MRLIDADKLREVLQRLSYDDWNQGASISWAEAYSEIANMINAIPTVEVEPIKHGRWIGKPIAGYSTVRCSACGNVFSENNGKWNYCPDCGAKNG